MQAKVKPYCIPTACDFHVCTLRSLLAQQVRHEGEDYQAIIIAGRASPATSKTPMDIIACSIKRICQDPQETKDGCLGFPGAHIYSGEVTGCRVSNEV